MVANLLTVKNELRHVRVQFWVGEFILYVWSAETERRKGTLCVLSVTGTEPGPRANCTASATWSGGSKPAELFQVLLYLKTINLLDFWFKSTGFLSYAYITVKYIKARLWIVVKSAIITLWHWRFIERSYSLILSRSGPQLFFCLLCRCQGYFIFCYTFVSLRRRFNSNQRKKGEASTVAPLIKTSLPITRNFGRPILSNHLRQD